MRAGAKRDAVAAALAQAEEVTVVAPARHCPSRHRYMSIPTLLKLNVGTVIENVVSNPV